MMEIARAWEEEGVKIPAPYARTIKRLLGPDKGNVEEISFQHALIDPGGQTDYHAHDRPELIYVVSGSGICICEGEETQVQGDVALWVRAGEKHQIKNTGAETLKLATVFVPGYTAEYTFRRCLEAAGAPSQGS